MAKWDNRAVESCERQAVSSTDDERYLLNDLQEEIRRMMHRLIAEVATFKIKQNKVWYVERTVREGIYLFSWEI